MRPRPVLERGVVGGGGGLRVPKISPKLAQRKLSFGKFRFFPLFGEVGRGVQWGGGWGITPELRLDSGNPMAAGCEGNSVPEAAGCDPSLCPRLPGAVIVELVDVHWL